MKQRKCHRCGAPGHNARTCPKDGEILSLDGQNALRCMVPASFAIDIVLAGPTALQDALLGALKGEEAMRASKWMGNSRTLSNAYRELMMRAREVPDDMLDRARDAKRELYRAQAAYAEATRPIQEILMPPSVPVDEIQLRGDDDKSAVAP